MYQLYLFILSAVAIVLILMRRRRIYKKEQKARFQEKINKRVQELQKFAHEDNMNRFREQIQKEQRRKKFDLAEYSLKLKKADVAMGKKQWVPAKQILIQAMALHKHAVEAGLRLAFIYQQCDEINKAENLYRRLLEAQPRNAEIYTNLGRILVKKKRYKEAIKAYTRAIDLEEKNDQNLIALGRLYSLLMHYDSAIECFHQAALLKPREVEYLFLIARANEDRQNEEGALLAYERILTVEPYNERAREAAQDLRIKLHSK